MWRGANYRRFPVKVASSPSCTANPPGLVRVVFLAVLPGLLLAESPDLFSESVIRYFVSGFWFWLSWLCDQGIVQDSDRLSQSSLAARRNCKVTAQSITILFLIPVICTHIIPGQLSIAFFYTE